jgi:hypothetical protein
MAKKGGGFMGGRSPSLGASLIEEATGVNVDPDPLGMRAKNNPPGNESADLLARIAGDLYKQTDPLRKSLIGRSGNFLDGSLDVTNSPMYGSLKNAVDSQFKRARDNTIGTTAPGGALTGALSNLEGSRASTMTQGIGELAEGELNRAFGLATGMLPQTTSGLGTAAGIQSQQLMAQQQQSAQAKQGAGAGLGMLVAAMAS